MASDTSHLRKKRIWASLSLSGIALLFLAAIPESRAAALGTVLQHGTRSHQTWAIKRLQALGDRGIPYLLFALEQDLVTPDPIRALEKIGLYTPAMANRVSKHLESHAGERDPCVIHASRLLGDMGSVAIPDVLKLSAHKDVIVRGSGLGAIYCMPWKTLSKAEKDLLMKVFVSEVTSPRVPFIPTGTARAYTTNRVVSGFLSFRQDTALPILIAELESANDESRVRLLREIEQFEREAISDSSIRALLADPNPTVRQAAQAVLQR